MRPGGGIGVQEQRRLAKVIGLEQDLVVRLLVLAGDTQLITTGMDAGRLTRDGADWLDLEETEAYVALLRGVVEAGVSRLRDGTPPLSGYGWVHETVPSFGELLKAATQPADHSALVTWVSWRWSGADPDRVGEELAGLELLGLRERGHPAPWLGPLLAGEDPLPALRAVLPPEQDEAVFQADGTAVVAGRPSAELARLLALVAVRESDRSWRLTHASVRTALDAGHSAEDLTKALHACSRHALPQVLEQLLKDVASQHGRIQVFASSTLLRVDDEPLRITLLRDRKLAALALQEVQPGVLSSVKKPADVMAAIRKAGHAPVGPPEKPPALPKGRPAALRRQRYPDLADVVRELRTPSPKEPTALHVRPAAWQPNVSWHEVYTPQLSAAEAHLLHLAIQDGEMSVEIDYVDVRGRQTTRVISQLTQDGPMLDAWCELRDDERMFSLHNVLAVRVT